MKSKQRKKRSDRIIHFVKTHPAINTAMLCRLAGGYNVSNFTNALAGKRTISEQYLAGFEKALKEYGFEPLKEGDN